MTTRNINIAVDGPGSAGKGTVARGVARKLGFQYIDTGAMYRSVALFCRRKGVAWNNEEAVADIARNLSFFFGWDGDVLRIVVNGEDVTHEIRTNGIGRGASDVSALPAVRAALLELQRSLGEQGGVVMDGRDIGTVVLPDAELKIYLDANLSIRARRRHDEQLRRGDPVPYEQVKAGLEFRDTQDQQRAVAPLKQADDAVYVDTSDMSIGAAVRHIMELARARL